MSDIPNPHDVKHAVDSSTGAWSLIATGLAGAMATVGGFVFKDQNQRLQALEYCQRKMATKEDIKDIHKKIENLSKDNTDRIIAIIEKLPKG